MADEREQQIRERLEHWHLNHWHCQVCDWWGPQCCTCPNCGSDTGKPLVSDAENLTYLLDALDAAREENGRLRDQVSWLYERIAETMDAERFQAFVERQAGAALAREDGGKAAIDSQLRQMLGDEEFERFREAVDGPREDGDADR